MDENLISGRVRTLLPLIVENAVKIITLLTALSFSASIVYDSGFFYALNLSFSDLPSTFSDHARDALNWVPFAILVIFGAVVLNRMDLKFNSENAKRDRLLKMFGLDVERDQQIKPPKMAAKFASRHGDKIARLLLIGMPTLWILSPTFSNYIGSAIALWFSIYFLFVYDPEEENTTKGRIWSGILLFVPVLIFIIWETGRENGVDVALSPVNEFIVYANENRETRVTIVRYFDKGLLIKNGDTSISFAPWSEIRRIDTGIQYTHYNGLICILTGWKPSCPRTRSFAGLPDHVESHLADTMSATSDGNPAKLKPFSVPLDGGATSGMLLKADGQPSPWRLRGAQ